ncbi:flagellin [Opitutales bacterium ASA1]|uniref:flagellin N-terminal helical domain-containing protein n=1 Tax=Congregicoccus parvus TaxID=3081749 RepID=UPI002B2E19CC|nr:flagellin [Opitutales bacterium ASA1]
MRVTSNSFPDNLVGHLQRLTGRMNTLQEQTATGQRINDPSDDPSAAVRVINYKGERSSIAQYYRNAQRADDIITASTAEVRNIFSVSSRANEIVSLTSDILGPDAMDAYAIEIDALLEQALVNANSNFNGEPLFGGTGAAQRPYEAVRDADGRITGINFIGSTTTARFQVAEGNVVSPYATPQTSQNIRDFLQNLVSFRDALASGVDANVKAQAPALQNSEDALIGAISGLGALQARIEVDMAQNSTRFSELAEQISREADVDLAQAVVKLSQNQTAYQAALMSAGKVLDKSLLDYL